MIRALPRHGAGMEGKLDKGRKSMGDIIVPPRINEPLVSIVTPSYNQGQFIETALLSVKNQDYSNVEHLVMDGGSSDNTLEILRRYEKEYDLKWISEPDKGQSDAVNKGFERASGQIIGWLNSDDVYVDRQVLSCVVAKFEEFSDADAIHGDGITIDENNLVLKVINYIPWFSFRRLVRFNFIIQPSCFLRREIVQQHKLDAKIDLPMDYEYYLRLASQGCKFKHINMVLSATRWHEKAKSVTRHEEVRAEAKRVRDLYGQQYNLAYYLGFIFDDIFILLLRAWGVRTMVLLRINSKKHNLAFPARFDSLAKAIVRQLSFDPRLVLG
jgi:glycosyltransferase involved in cell wall biosynthesis